MVGRPTLDQFVVLSVLLHVIAIAIFGDTSGTGERRGDRAWGTLNVRVQAARADDTVGIGLKLDTRGILEPRKGTPADPAETAQPPPPPMVRATAATETAPPATQTAEASAPRPIELPTSVPVVEDAQAPLPAPSVREFLATDLVQANQAFVVPPPLAVSPAEPARLPRLSAPAPIEAIQLPSTARDLAPINTFKAQALPLTVPAPIDALATVKVEQALAPARLTPREIARAAPTLIEPIAPAKVEQELLPTTALKTRELPLAAPAPIETLKAAVPTQEFAPVTALKSREVAVVAPRPIDAIATVKSEAEFAPATAVQAKPVQRAAAPPIDSVALPKATAEFAPTSALKVRPVESVATTAIGTPAAGGSAEQARGGGTAAGVPSILDDALRGRPRPPPPAPAAEPSAPLVNLDALRDRARQIDRGDVARGPKGLLPFPMVAKPAEKSTVEKAFDKALKRKDCREAFADLGLAAVFPLMLSTVKDDLCKW